MFYTAKMPRIIKKLAPSLVYEINDDEKSVYLTFDDGPVPETTPFILDILSRYDAKATFFCLGKNVQQYPHLYQIIRETGHKTGNHSYSHLDGWKTKNKIYFDDIEAASHLIDSSLFRPPYGRITPAQIRHLKKKYKIIMWDVVSGDFDPGTSLRQCRDNVLDNVSPGSIVVMHDSLKAKEKVLGTLPVIMEKLASEGYKFKTLE